jgi:hypothetical protein
MPPGSSCGQDGAKGASGKVRAGVRAIVTSSPLLKVTHAVVITCHDQRKPDGVLATSMSEGAGCTSSYDPEGRFTFVFPPNLRQERRLVYLIVASGCRVRRTRPSCSIYRGLFQHRVRQILCGPVSQMNVRYRGQRSCGAGNMEVSGPSSARHERQCCAAAAGRFQRGPGSAN